MDRKLSNEELRAQMDEEARLSESAAYDDEDDGAPLPPHVKVSRPNRGKVLQIRLSDAEMAALDEIAAGRDLKVSTLAREQLLKLVAPEPSVPLLVQVSRLEEAAHALRNRLVHDPAYQGLLTQDDFAEARTLPPY